MKPGAYPEIGIAEYLRLPAISSGVIRAMTDRCPKAAWFESYLNPDNQRADGTIDGSAPDDEPDDSTEASNVGTIAHSIILENSTAGIAVIDPKDHANEKGGGYARGWTNKSIKAAKAQAIADGKTPVLPATMRRIDAMVASARAYIEALKSKRPAIWHAFESGYGQSEVTMVWNDDGTTCRMRPDRISADRHIAIHLKTTKVNAEPAAFGRGVFTREGYDTTAAFYRRGMRALYGESTHVFLVVEQAAPHLCSLIGLDSEWAAYADAKVERAIRAWRACVQANDWPGYPADLAYLGLSAWRRAEFEEMGMAEAGGYPYDPAVLYAKETA